VLLIESNHIVPFFMARKL